VRDRSRAILFLTLAGSILALGGIFVFLPILPTLTVVGFFMMMFGAVLLLAVTGVFSGTPYRSRILNRADRELKRREKKRYSD
jgi:membrane protein implicated in regulation of membrane protease activity